MKTTPYSISLHLFSPFPIFQFPCKPHPSSFFRPRPRRPVSYVLQEPRNECQRYISSSSPLLINSDTQAFAVTWSLKRAKSSVRCPSSHERNGFSKANTISLLRRCRILIPPSEEQESLEKEDKVDTLIGDTHVYETSAALKGERDEIFGEIRLLCLNRWSLRTSLAKERHFVSIPQRPGMF